MFFSRGTGAYQGQYAEANALGTFALLAGNNLFTGPATGGGGNGGGAQITHASDAGGGVLATYANGNAIIVTTNRSYLLSDTSLTALDRATRSQIWSKAMVYPYTLILAGATLYAGGDNEVAAFDSATGNKLWSHPVRGRAQGLAVAGGTLFVSTDEGLLHTFVQDQTRQQSALILQ
jgi:outer membrane protein assembly factor BamB